MRKRFTLLLLVVTIQTGLAIQPAARLVWTIPREAYFWGDVSPDGRSIAFGNRNDGEIYVHQFASGISQRVTSGARYDVDAYDREGHGDDSWTFSTDGRQLAYSWQIGESESLRVAAVTGTARDHVLVAHAGIRWISALSWSPDDSWIAVSLTRKASDRTELCLAPAAGGALRVLDTTEGANALGRAIFSPDGRQILYSRAPQAGRPHDIFTVAVETGIKSVVLQHDANETVLGWSPDGRELVFQSDREGTLALWAAGFANGQLGPPRRLRTVSRDDETMGLTRSGSWFYRVYRRPSWTFRILSIDFNTGTVSSPALAVPTARDRAWFPAAWSVDGALLAAVSSTEPGGRLVAIHSSDGRQVRQVKPALTNFENLVWSPDRRAFATLGADSNRRRGLYRVDTQTGEASLLGEGATFFRAWSADGTRVYFDRVIADGSRDVEIVERDVASNQERRVHRATAGVAANQTRVLSADGRMLYFLNPGTPSPSAHTLTSKDLLSGREAILLSDRRFGPLALSGGGTFVVTSSDGAPLLIPVNGGKPRTLPQISGQTAAIVAWAPDDRSVLARTTAANPDSRATYWWIPLDGRQARPLDLSAGSTIGLLASASSAVALIERQGPISPPGELWALDLFDALRVER